MKPKKQQIPQPKVYKNYTKQDDDAILSYDRDVEETPKIVVTKPGKVNKCQKRGSQGSKVKGEVRYHLDLLGC